MGARRDVPDVPRPLLHLLLMATSDGAKEVEEWRWSTGPLASRPSCVSCCRSPVPGLVCAALSPSPLSWNEFIYALTFTSSSEEITASVGVHHELIRGDSYFGASLMGAPSSAPSHRRPLRLLLDYYVSGLTAGALK